MPDENVEQDEQTTEPEVEAPELVTMNRAEVDALRRKVAEAEKQRRKIEAEAKMAEEGRQAKDGEYEKLAAQRERERDEALAAAERTAREARVTRIAGRLGFLDPEDVVGRVTAEQGADDASAEARLEQIAKTSSHLLRPKDSPQPVIGQVLEPAAAPSGKSPLTMEQVKKMTPEEINERWDDVQQVLAASPV